MATELNRTVLNKRLCFKASEQLEAEIARAADERELSAAAWLRQAVKAYLRTATKYRKTNRAMREPEYFANGYPKRAKCFYCKSACHNPTEHHVLLSIEPEDIEWGKAHPCEDEQ